MMMKMSGLLVLLGIVIVAMGSLRTAQAVTGNVNCGTIAIKFFPCLPYLQSTALRPPAPLNACCSNLKALNNAQGAQRQGTCECIKQNANSISGLVPARVSDLSSKCGISLALKVNQNTDCTKACLPARSKCV